MKTIARIPPLEDGQRLSAGEFMRRYEAMPEAKHWQLIEGVVHMPPPPTSTSYHGQPQFLLLGWIFAYGAATAGVAGSAPSTVRLDLDNVPEPDGALFVLPEHGGQVRFDEKGYIVGAPDLVIEVAASSLAIDMNEKFRAYRRNGVREYLVWKTEKREIVWFAFDEGEATQLEPDAKGRLASRAFPGLVLDVRAALANDAARVLATLQTALKTKAHLDFARRLRQAGRNSRR